MLIALAGAMASIAFAAKTPERIFEEASKSVVVIHSYGADDKPINQGSGIVVGKESVITNCHVVEKSVYIKVPYQARLHTATVRNSDIDRDLCELQVSQLPAPRAIVWTGALKVGQRVYAIGAPEGLELTISEGLVSSVREFEGSTYIQTSAPISAGSSGGGLFDVEGRLVGITAFIVPEGQNINFALPASWIGELMARGGSRLQTAAAETASDKWTQRAGELRARREWLPLLALAQQWVRSAPGSLPAWQQLGDAYRVVNRPRRAIIAYQQGLRLDPDAYGIWLNLGASYLTLNQYDRAIEAFTEALRVKPNDVPALSSAGTAYYFQNRQDKVKEMHGALAKVDAAAAREFARKYVKSL
jgi:hypothetical protein